MTATRTVTTATLDTLARGIARERERAGLSQRGLARVMGVDHSAVCRWESGARCPGLGRLIALSDYFGVSLDALVRGQRT